MIVDNNGDDSSRIDGIDELPSLLKNILMILGVYYKFNLILKIIKSRQHKKNTLNN